MNRRRLMRLLRGNIVCGRQGSRDKLILRTGIFAPLSLRYYLSLRLPFTNLRWRRAPQV